jgi:hypothetical protein
LWVRLLGAWAWYELGRGAARSDRIRSDAIDAVLGLKPRQADINAILAENHALQQEIAQLREQLADYEYNYNNLRQWADGASVRLKAYRAKEQD